MQRRQTHDLRVEGAEPEARPAKFGVPVCPHAGGVGLCEYVQHLAVFDYIAVSASLERRMVEYVDQLHDHFLDPVDVVPGRYRVPMAPGYSITMKPESCGVCRSARICLARVMSARAVLTFL